MNQSMALSLALFTASTLLAQPLPKVVVKPAPLYRFPGVSRLDKKHAVDCNSPSHWNGKTFYLFNSYGQPHRGSAARPLAVRSMAPTHMDGTVDGHKLTDLYIWLESTWRDEDGTLYGWYHYEPDDICKPGEHLPTAPRIGALRSRDDGATWEHLGIVLDAPPDSVQCDTLNHWDSGGHGDFSVIADQQRQYLYFLFSSYVKDFAEQGVGIARMRYEDRDAPAGKVLKWHRAGWSEPGRGGRLTPIFPAKKNWHTKDADLFWGPAIHWNTHLRMFVVLLNRAVDNFMKGDGTYVAFTTDLSNPASWSQPVQILTAVQARAATRAARPGNGANFAWYPQVMGTGAGETDKLAGKVARLFLAGVSAREIVFLKPGERE